MGSMFTKSNLTAAGIAGLAAYLAMNLTSTQSKLIQGLAVVGALVVALPLAAKV